MRIISGKHKGRKLRAPIIDEIRPTTDFAKTGLFNVLNNHIDFEDIVVLDLFSGFGNIAFEFASRGAQFVDTVDSHPQSIKFIKQFASQIQLPVNAYQSDALQFLHKVHQKYDIIFADPPFDMSDLLDDVLEIVVKRGLLKPNGILILEHEKNKSFSNHPMLFDERKYGKVHFSFFRKTE
ncbi:MAG: methyltransferase [Bacteroidia bacterium]|nr:MAG: methyltransferase [Bacteroidia bacterium]